MVDMEFDGILKFMPEKVNNYLQEGNNYTKVLKRNT